ncbi:unnamed protein product [Rotaria sordida]|uniref:B30.2/SPRY domain-containing protein n=1 Tax=Rotaria sordida TaxID=392033 RepID=A0A819PRY7_9BILA|nr:unnamed protein product [Rotaria sordida]
MASSSSKKLCSTGDGCKQVAITTCDGCSQAFCFKHFTEHRNLLNDELNKIICEHDDLKNSLTQQTNNPICHPLITQVNEWETQSILKIQQRAKELRQELSELTKNDTNNLSQKLQHLAKQINECREHGDFLETDLYRWKETLDDLKLNTILSSKITINPVNGNPLIENISVNIMNKPTNELFEKVSDNRVQIRENGHTVVDGGSSTIVEVRGKNEYVSGVHKIRLCIEEFSGTWLFFGINAKSTPVQNDVHSAKSTYGWSNNNYSWSNGRSNPISSNHPIEMKKNDVIGLMIDCDDFKISMINERTHTKHELTVDINYCSLPWQFNVILYEKNTRIRILSPEFTS